MAEIIWKKFEKDLKKLVSNIDNTVLKKIKTNFIETPLEYLKSDECDLVIKDTIEKISYNKSKAYIHLLDFKKILKSESKVKRKCVIEPVSDNKRRKLADEECTIDNFLVKVKDEDEDFLDYYNGCTTSVQPVQKCDEPKLKVDQTQLKVDKYIIKLENVLQATKAQIERLEEEELSLDDLDQENNSFIMLDKLKAHCVKVWRKICKLRNSSSRLHRRNLKTFSFQGTKYPDLNILVEDFVKMKKFPDYNDIRIVVMTYVKEKSINMSSQKISELAVDIFTQIGNKLKKLRIGEFVNYFGNHLTDQVKSNENPIYKDDKLKKVLVRSYALGQIKLDEILDKFSKADQGTLEDDSASDISTEHSVDSNNEEIDEDLEDITVDTVQNESNLKLDEICSSNGDVDQLPEEPQIITKSSEPEPSQNITQQNDHIELPHENGVTDIIPTNSDGSNINTVCLVNDTECAIDIANDDESQEHKIDTEQQIKEMACHTFKFNIDQIRQGENGIIYPATITINSSDDDEYSVSSDDNPTSRENQFAYSSKLDDFCIAKRKPPQIVDTGIFISIDDSDDDKTH